MIDRLTIIKKFSSHGVKMQMLAFGGDNDDDLWLQKRDTQKFFILKKKNLETSFDLNLHNT